MKIVTYNIRYCLGMDGKTDIKRIADTVKDADIIALQEVDRYWRRTNMVDQVEELAKHLNTYYWSFGPAFDVDASQRRDDGTVLNRRRQFGTMLFSKWPILSSRLLILPKTKTLANLNMDTGALECVVDTPHGPIRAYSIHLSSISVQERLDQIDLLLDWHRKADRRGGPSTGGNSDQTSVEYENYLKMDWANGEPHAPTPFETIIMGDFNSIPESPEYNRFVGEIDPAMGRIPNIENFVDSWEVAQENDKGNGLTWYPDPPDRTPGYPLRLDYCMLTPNFAGKVRRAWVDRAADGSDHLPYWVELDH